MSNPLIHAFFVGRAVADLLYEQLEHTLTDALSELGKFDAEQRERWRQFTQEAIARALNKPVKDVYRLREKISYHAIRVFALKIQPELVASWLETSLSEHDLGLTPHQWQHYWEKLTPVQQQILEMGKAGKSFDAIANTLKMKSNQVMGEWSKLYLAALDLRSAS